MGSASTVGLISTFAALTPPLIGIGITAGACIGYAAYLHQQDSPATTHPQLLAHSDQPANYRQLIEAMPMLEASKIAVQQICYLSPTTATNTLNDENVQNESHSMGMSRR